MSSFDIGTITSAVLHTMALGLVSEEQAAADSICYRVSAKSTLSGTIPRLTNATTMARVSPGLPPGAEATPHEGAQATTSYNCLAYHGRALVTDEERNDLAVYGLDQLRERARQARANANVSVDNELDLVLQSTSLNNEYDNNTDGSGEWDDYTNSKPLQDMIEAKHTLAPGADKIVYGPAVKRALLGHPDIKAETSYFNAGQIDINGLNAILSAKLGIPLQNIHYVEKFYNSAAEGAAISTTYLFNEVFWMGHHRDLIMVDPMQAAMNNKLTIDPVNTRRSVDVNFVRWVDIIRPTQQLGVTFSNTIT